MLDGVNDAPAHARELAAHRRGSVRCKFNLIPFNPFPNSELRALRPGAHPRASPRSSRAPASRSTTRKTRGDDIDAACGQLAGDVADRTRRSERRIAAEGGARMKPRCCCLAALALLAGLRARRQADGPSVPRPASVVGEAGDARNRARAAHRARRRSTTSRGNMSVALEELRIAIDRRPELRAGLRHVRPGLHGAEGERARRAELRARAAPRAERARPQPQLRLVPVPDRSASRSRSSISCRRSATRSTPRRGAPTPRPACAALRAKNVQGRRRVLPARAEDRARRAQRAAAARARSATAQGRMRRRAHAGAALQQAGRRRAPSRCGSRCASSARPASAPRSRATPRSCAGASRPPTSTASCSAEPYD